MGSGRDLEWFPLLCWPLPVSVELVAGIGSRCIDDRVVILVGSRCIDDRVAISSGSLLLCWPLPNSVELVAEIGSRCIYDRVVIMVGSRWVEDRVAISSGCHRLAILGQQSVTCVSSDRVAIGMRSGRDLHCSSLFLLLF
ncbi:hypothetical protein L2E82_17449 [Cichorium intybus]|uniref:Uncharacterized protein n=1 Tax=Cichorium intybus TaxID=13427 RepID=A0ACB9F7X2_CICIN|nr:hypothetical protein L2E82_17449 [Cichorium intybus]